MFHPILEVSPVVPLKLFCNVGLKNDSGRFLAFQGGLLHNVVFRLIEKHLVLILVRPLVTVKKERKRGVKFDMETVLKFPTWKDFYLLLFFLP